MRPQERPGNHSARAASGVDCPGDGPLLKKACKTCGEVKCLSDFHVDRRAKDGRCGICKWCRQAAKRAWEKANRLRINARRRRRYWQDPEGARARRRRWRRANLESARAAGRRHYAANRGRVLAYHAKYRRRNRHKIDAQIVVKAGIITGDLVRGPCEVCGARPSQRRIHGHHVVYRWERAMLRASKFPALAYFLRSSTE